MSSVWCSAAALSLYIRVNGGAIWCSDLYRVSFLRKRKLHSYRLVRPQKYMDSKTAIAVGVGAGAGALIAAVGAPLVLGAIGFTSAGIAAGSYAASMMSAAAVANGGAVVAGGVVASLQAAGAAGLSGAATAAVSGVGAAVGWLVSLIRGKEKS